MPPSMSRVSVTLMVKSMPSCKVDLYWIIYLFCLNIFVNFFSCVNNYLISFNSDANALSEARHRENQRRSDAAVEHASVLPPDVLSVLTQCDQVTLNCDSLLKHFTCDCTVYLPG